MQAGDVELGQVFIDNHQFEIPMFQRPYVWDAEKNWAPLWADIAAAADDVYAELQAGEFLEEPPTYFLGAVVVKAGPAHPQRLKVSLLVDGQQRLTTLQVLLAAARAVAADVGAMNVVGKLSNWIENNPEAIHDRFTDDKFKLWPLPQDREEYLWAVRKPDDDRSAPDAEHRLVRARVWFEHQIKAWASGTGADRADRLDALHSALTNRMKLVRITLDKTDDMQVIFEALNHRGVELSQSDLVKNLLFRLVEEQGDHARAEQLLTDHWLMLDLPRWRQLQTTGRIHRSKLDLVVSYWLTIQKHDVVKIENLFDEFKAWMFDGNKRASEVIKSLRRAADVYDWLHSRSPDEDVQQFIDHLVATKTNTLWPVVLATFLSDSIPEPQKVKVTRVLGSYLIRRQVCQATSKDYNRYFASLIELVVDAPEGAAGDALERSLSQNAAESRSWPNDDEFAAALLDHNVYGLAKPAVRALFAGLENHLRDSYAEDATPIRANVASLNIEHVMPQSWWSNWPLRLPQDADEETAAAARLVRSQFLNSLGNLTLTNGKLNTVMSNAAWPVKLGHLRAKSTFLITTASILSAPPNLSWQPERDWTADWTEQNIAARTQHLVDLALQVWPRPGTAPTDTAEYPDDDSDGDD